MILQRPDELRALLERARTIAILGAHHEDARPAFYVGDYLRSVGYRVLPVNPSLVGRTVFGQPVVASLTDLAEPVDIVDVFRRGDVCHTHLDEILAMNPRPGVVWLQLGIRSDLLAQGLEGTGVDLVQDRCTLADHRRLVQSS